MVQLLFVGVTTQSSLIHQAMPKWAPLLNSAAVVSGRDISLGAADDVYHGLLRDMSRDDSVLGAVVTTHKSRIFQACKERFTYLDPLAMKCEEINAIRRTDHGLYGWARDPVSTGRVLDRIWPSAAGEVVCLGAGGTATAIAHHLSSTRPEVRLTCVDRDRRVIEGISRVARRDISSYVGEGPWDELVAAAAPACLVVNATGMGKDRPGSPITDAARFPRGSVVWELNYRGELRFLHHARRQASTRELQVHDGWELFCFGWASALAAVHGIDDATDLGDRFVRAANDLRPVSTG